MLTSVANPSEAMYWQDILYINATQHTHNEDRSVHTPANLPPAAMGKPTSLPEERTHSTYSIKGHELTTNCNINTCFNCMQW